jgi:substrate-binding protein of zinc uptake complex component A/QueF-like protein
MPGWLDPENALIWFGLIADALAGLDPDNSDTYRANAAAAIADVGALATATTKFR